jgi:hypothetical protein
VRKRRRIVRLFYVDESGEAHLKPNGPRHYLLGGISIQDTSWRAVDADVRELLDLYRPRCREQIYASLRDPHHRAAAWWVRRALQRKGLTWTTMTQAQRTDVERHIKNRLADEFEIHAVDMFHGHEVYEGVTKQLRMEMMDATATLIAKHHPQVICVVLDKKKHIERYGDKAWPPDSWSFAVLSDAFDEHLRKSCENEPGMFIADTGGTDAATARRSLKRFQTRGTPWFNNKCERVVESIHFVPSHTSAGVQLADFVVYLIRHWIERGDSKETRPMLARIGKACRFRLRRRP